MSEESSHARKIVDALMKSLHEHIKCNGVLNPTKSDLLLVEYILWYLSICTWPFLNHHVHAKTPTPHLPVPGTVKVLVPAVIVPTGFTPSTTCTESVQRAWTADVLHYMCYNVQWYHR